MLVPETIQQVNAASDKESPYSGKEILSVILIEGRDLSRPARLVNVLESIELLFQSCAVLTETPSESVTVIACDSGSDKSFDFLGAAKVMEALKEVILSLWDRIVFYRELQIAERLELVAQSLPIMEKIGILEQEKRLGREQAELLRRDVLSGVTKFVESGATIPELEERAHFSPRLLLSPVQKLLVASRDDDLPSKSTGSPDIPNRLVEESEQAQELSEDEVSELRRLLKSKRTNDSEDLRDPEEEF